MFYSFSINVKGSAMKIVCCPDSFKESMTAARAAAALAAGARRAIPDAQCVEVPMADGGEGFARAIADALGARVITLPVAGVRGATVTAELALAGERAIFESAAAVGLDQLRPEERDIRRSDSTGVGQLIARALDEGATEILVGLGGSATNDGGAGMLAALGARFYDDAATELGTTPAEMVRLARADFSGLDSRLAGVTIRVACDVDNPLLGERGASAIYGPQKGASPEDVEFLDRVLRNFATVAGKMDVQETPGAGAAGGLGFAFLLRGASLESGVDLVMDTVGLAEAMAGADLVLTGEGAMDRQTLMGKTLSGVARLAAAAGGGGKHTGGAKPTGVPIIAFAGKLGEGVEDLYEHGFVGLVPIVDRPCTLDEALAEGAANLENAAERALRLYVAGQRA